MPRSDNIETEGVVEECLPGTKFKVKLDNGATVMCTIAGKMRVTYIKVLLGDRVKVAISPYDITKGIITFRSKN